jgi:Tfp pilus assembly protein PilZ
MPDSNSLVNKEHIKSRLLELADNLSEDQVLVLIKKAEELLSDIDRQELRKLFPKRIHFWVQNIEYEGIIRDISCSGVFILTDKSFPMGRDVSLSLPLQDHQGPIAISGEIARISSKGIGIKFKNLSKQDEDVIKSVIDSC